MANIRILSFKGPYYLANNNYFGHNYSRKKNDQLKFCAITETPKFQNYSTHYSIVLV